MSEDHLSRRLIGELLPIVVKHQPSPEQLRYVFKQLREQTGIKRPSRPQALPKFYSPAEIYALLEGAAKCSPKHRLLVDMLLQSGLRISEFHKLDLRDLYPDQHQLAVLGGKGGKDRMIPLGGTLYQQIRLSWKSVGANSCKNRTRCTSNSPAS